MKMYLKECPDETVALWTANGQPVWTFASLPEALEGAIEWAGQESHPSRPGIARPKRLDSAA